jgi:divalent metal cation (Fe/Co/Zn/Cd) transporter
MYDLIINTEGVIVVDDLKTRLFGSKIYVDVEIGADGNLSLYEAHDIAQRIHEDIEEKFSDVKHIMVHVNPKTV